MACDQGLRALPPVALEVMDHSQALLNEYVSILSSSPEAIFNSLFLRRGLGTATGTDGGGQLGQQGVGFIPADTAVGDALSVDKRPA